MEGDLCLSLQSTHARTRARTRSTLNPSRCPPSKLPKTRHVHDAARQLPAAATRPLGLRKALTEPSVMAATWAIRWSAAMTGAATVAAGGRGRCHRSRKRDRWTSCTALSSELLPPPPPPQLPEPQTPPITTATTTATTQRHPNISELIAGSLGGGGRDDNAPVVVATAHVARRCARADRPLLEDCVILVEQVVANYWRTTAWATLIMIHQRPRGSHRFAVELVGHCH